MSQKTLEYLIAQGLVRTIPGNSDYIIINSFTNPQSNSYTASETSEYAIKISDFFAAVGASTSAEEVSFDPAVLSQLSATNVQDAVDELTQAITLLAPYKVYTALLTQTGTTAPVATVLQNTLGTVSFAYTGVGQYTVTGTGLFVLNKTDIEFGDVMTSAHDWCSIYVDAGTLTTNSFVINVQDLSTTSQNGVLSKTKIEIKVYN